MKPGEREARLLAVADLSGANRKLVADSASIASLIVRLLADEPTGRVLGTLRKLQKGGRTLDGAAAAVMARLDAFYATPKEQREALRKESEDRRRAWAAHRERVEEISRHREDWWNDPSMNGDEEAERHRLWQRRDAEPPSEAALTTLRETLATAEARAAAARKSAGNVVYLRRPGGGRRP